MANINLQSPLTPIGFDIPQAPPTTPSAPQSLSQPDTTGLNLVSKATEFTQQAFQAKSRADQQIAQSVGQVAQAANTSVQQISQAAAMVAQTGGTRSASVNASLLQLGGSITEVITSTAKKAEAERLARLKAAQELSKTQATVALENAQVEWIEGGRIDKEGTAAYRKTVGDTLAQYQISAEDIASLTQKYYAPAIDYAKKTESNRIDAAEKITTQQRAIRVEGLKAKLSTSLGGLAASAGLGEEIVQGHYDTIQSAVIEYMQNEEMPLIDRLTGAATAYASVNEVMGKTNADTSRIQQQLNSFNATAQFAADLQQQVLMGQLSITDYNQRVKQEAIKNDIPGFDIPDPSAPVAFMKKIQQDQRDIKELQREDMIDAIEAVAADDSVIGSLTTQFALNPAALEAVKATNPKMLDKNTKAAIAMVEDFNKWKFDNAPQYKKRRAAITTDMMDVQKGFQTWLVGATNRGASGASSPSEAKILEALRIGGVTPEAVQRGLTQEQANAVATATNDILAAKKQEADALDEEFEVNRARFARYGMHLDPAQTKAAMNAFDSARQGFAKKQQEIRSAKPQTYQQQPGQSPNFNGGAPGKPKNWTPLARTTYGGRTVTMPFSAAVANTIPQPTDGMKYGAYRTATRNHAGLDFPVSTGTPALSMVYGTITSIDPHPTEGYGKHVEVKGDDGFTYFYAHLDSVAVSKGQRVGPGQMLAKTGNTGGGLSTGPHLHLEVYQGAPTNRVDPLQHLATRKFGDPPKGVRTGNKGSAPVMLPTNAIPLGNDNYLVDGKVRQIQGGGVQRFGVAAYSPSTPLRSSYQGGSGVGGKGNLGYARLAKDTSLQSALHRVSANLNIPSEWLADLMAYESAGTFSSSIENPWGYTGLIQFGDDAMKDLGVTRQQLKNMTPAAQMTYVEKFIRLQMRYAGVNRVSSPEMLVAAINQGHTVMRDVYQRGAAAVLDPENRDGAGVTLKFYMENLGKFSGRQYTYMGDTRNRIRASVVHERPKHNCTMCVALQQQDTAFIPHEGQTA